MTESLIRSPAMLRSVAIELGAKAAACKTLPHVANRMLAIPWRPYGGALVSVAVAHTCPDTKHRSWYILGDTCGVARIWQVRISPLGMELSEAVPPNVAVAGTWWRAITGMNGRSA
jgi:hypothetical protein